MEQETPREDLDRESHYVWGRRCLLKVVEHDAPPAVEWRHHRLVLAGRPGMDEFRRGEVLEAWYPDQLREEAKVLTAEWESQLRVRVGRVFIQPMKTRWAVATQPATQPASTPIWQRGRGSALITSYRKSWCICRGRLTMHGSCRQWIGFCRVRSFAATSSTGGRCAMWIGPTEIGRRPLEWIRAPGGNR
jgi:hypothetical protein